MNQRIIINIIFVGVALILSIFIGQWVVTAPKEIGIGFAAVVAIITFLKLSENVWMLVPACTMLTVSFPWIPGGFSPVELASIYLVICTFFLILSHKVSIRLRMTSVEWMGFLLMLMLFQAYLRNPVGIRMLGSETVGGRPYVIVLIAFSAGLILASTRTELPQIQKLFKWSLLCLMGSLVIHALASFSVKIASYTGMVFGVYGKHVAAISEGGVTADPTRADRNSAGRVLAELSSRGLVAFRNPLRALLSPFWMCVLMSALIGAGMSGFRNVIASTGLTLVLGVYYWGRGRAVLVGCFIGIAAYVAINIINLAVPLPANIQRSLSFLPGSWEEKYTEDASASTEWRTIMWKEALMTDNYIENKVVGDGLGIRRSDFSRMLEISEARVITDEMSQERAMLAGDFHSGPVTTIRVMGYSGLILLIMTMLIVAVRAHKLILYSRNKPFFREVIFFCIPMVWFPLFFLFVFGSFKTSIPIFFIQMGLLRLLEINLKDRSGSLSEELPQV